MFLRVVFFHGLTNTLLSVFIIKVNVLLVIGLNCYACIFNIFMVLWRSKTINPSLLSRKILIVKGINNEVYKKVFLKNNKKCLIRNATGDDAQEVLNIFLLTHDQTDFLSSYKDENHLLIRHLKSNFCTDRETAARGVYLCAIV